MPDDKTIDITARTAEIREWVREARGRFNTKQLDYDLNIESSAAKGLRRQVLKRMRDAGELEGIPNLEGVYRTIEGPPIVLDWQHIDNPVVPLKFPFELEKWVKLYRKAIVCVAGDKDSGKTAFLYGFALLNMFHSLGVDLFYTGEGQFKERMYDSGIEIPNPAPFRVFERVDAFDQVIDPDRISVIDYLDVGSEFAVVGDEIEKIFKKLDKGVAIIALQKPTTGYTFVKGKKTKIPRDLGIGGVQTIKRAQLYLTMDGSKLKIFSAKGRAIPSVNPKNKMWSYRFDSTGWFCDIAEFQEAEGEDT